MAHRLTEYETLVMPDYGGFDLYDMDSDVRDNALTIPAYEHGAAGNGYEICVVTKQTQVKVKLHIETWSGEPPLPHDWESYLALALEMPTGHLVISERTRGAWETVIPPGHYQARIAHRGRDLVQPAVIITGRPEEVAHLEGVEEYLLQLWPRT
ncbi:MULTISPECIES: hypothetical protein [Streptomyces]|uniref:Uncharacterized protein n=1 Tax=Streptomyces ardesiacus TaxID=285564 RepID=A0ABW8HH31_9ACTN|nr:MULTISPECIES: hypothetical protein [unclassified Streptomyces]KOT94894.1 hypothetical protein ADK87_28490 [Streptomyces sp. NRRL F-4711]KOX51801.1 hypothetical protein ADL09_04190 [Streptomyces sp. NRRL F-7442]